MLPIRQLLYETQQWMHRRRAVTSSRRTDLRTPKSENENARSVYEWHEFDARVGYMQYIVNEADVRYELLVPAGGWASLSEAHT
jgi:hypothetical protein